MFFLNVICVLSQEIFNTEAKDKYIVLKALENTNRTIEREHSKDIHFSGAIYIFDQETLQFVESKFNLNDFDFTFSADNTVKAEIRKESLLNGVLKRGMLFRFYLKHERKYLSNLMFVRDDGEIHDINPESYEGIRFILLTWMLIGNIIQENTSSMGLNNKNRKNFISYFMKNRCHTSSFTMLQGMMLTITSVKGSELCPGEELQHWKKYISSLKHFDYNADEWEEYQEIFKCSLGWYNKFESYLPKQWAAIMTFIDQIEQLTGKISADDVESNISILLQVELTVF